MRILVTGFSGFVGGHLCQQLREKGHKVFGIARTPVASSPVEEANRYYFDLAEEEKLLSVFKAVMPDSVVHLAAQASVAESWRNPKETLDNAAHATLSLVNAVNQTPSVKYVVNVGSAEQYMPPATPTPLTENALLYPKTPYGLSKLVQEVLLYQMLKSQATLVRFRLFNLTGPGQSPRYVLGSFAQQIARIKLGISRPRVVTGNLNKIRDFLDVRDACRILTIAAEGGMPPEVYNLCSGIGRSLHEVLHSLLQVAGVEVEVVLDPGRLRAGDPDFMVGSSSCLKEAGLPLLQTEWTETLSGLLNYHVTRERCGGT